MEGGCLGKGGSRLYVPPRAGVGFNVFGRPGEMNGVVVGPEENLTTLGNVTRNRDGQKFEESINST